MKKHSDEIDHLFGPNVHILQGNTHIQERLAMACTEQSYGRALADQVRELYTYLSQIVVSAEFPTEEISRPTRMAKQTDRAVLKFQAPRRDTRTTVTKIIRAGDVSGQIVYEVIGDVLDASAIHVDYIVASRNVGPDGKILGTSINTEKMRGDSNGQTVVIPDLMGATGGTSVDVGRHYLTRGTPRKIIFIFLITTPECLINLTKALPDAIIYALRYDQGMSTDDAATQMPGPDAGQSGLDHNGYIVPGGGGMGEALTGTDH